MIPNKIDVEFTPDDVDAVMAALDTVLEKLPFLIGLSEQERRHLSRLGRKTQAFTHQSLDLAAQHPELMPRYFSVEGAQRDMNVFASLNQVLQAISELDQLVRDTQAIAGSEAYAAARKAYLSIKKDGQGLGLEDAIQQLSEYCDHSRTPVEATT